MPDQEIKNEYGEVVLFSPTPSEARGEALTGQTAIQIANRFILEKMRGMGLAQSRLESDERAFTDPARSDDPVMAVTEQKGSGNSAVVIYDQIVSGLQVFNARMGVHVDMAAGAVTSLQSSMHNHVSIANPDARASEAGRRNLTNAALKNMLGFDLPNMKEGLVPRQVVYRYEPDERVEEVEDDQGGCFGGHDHVELTLPPVPTDIRKGEHYIVDEVLFAASRFEQRARSTGARWSSRSRAPFSISVRS